LFEDMISMTAATLTGLVVGIASIIVQFIAAPELFGVVLPGAFVIAAFAVFVALGTRWWWSRSRRGHLDVGRLRPKPAVDRVPPTRPASAGVSVGEGSRQSRGSSA
jgi:hypothetical protein